ncbi:CCA-adding enzyme [uncultured archaeon]|nr:CCA-adding enzyme [uncultured archaeon]
MAKAQEVLINVLEKISLDPKEEKRINEVAKKVISKIKKLGLKSEIGGSLAKKTLIKKPKQDVDLFVQLKDKKDLDKFYSKIKTLDLEGQFLHGSRDYYTFNTEGVQFEIIPIVKFKKPELAENVTDFSLTHVNFIKKEINKNKKLANEIKLAKAFCHAQNVYGAESYIGGFSGYALEVLVCHYGSFPNLLKNVSKEKIIDPKKQFKNKNDIMRELNQSKLTSPIILIDPTYKYRNVCAGLSQDTFDEFLKSAEEFLAKPSEEFFIKKEFNSEKFFEKAKKQNNTAIKLSFATEKQEGDIAGTKMKKLFKFFLEELERKEQNVVESEFIYEKGQNSVAYLSIKIKPELEIQGPKNISEMKEAIEKFKKVRGKIYFSKGFAMAKEKFNLEDFFKKQTETALSMKVGFDWEQII